MFFDGEIYDLLREEGYVQSHKLGSPVDVMGRATAVAVAKALQYGAPLEIIRHALTKLDGSEATDLG